jgi:hypothetical protein
MWIAEKRSTHWKTKMSREHHSIPIVTPTVRPAVESEGYLFTCTSCAPMMLFMLEAIGRHTSISNKTVQQWKVIWPLTDHLSMDIVENNFFLK